MIALLIAPMFAAAGYSLIYLLLGGGLGGAFLIFIVAKMVGKWVSCKIPGQLGPYSRLIAKDKMAAHIIMKVLIVLTSHSDETGAVFIGG